MRKFIKTLGIYACMIALVVVLVNYWYMALDNRDTNNTAKFENVPNNIQVCNLGSSHGLYGFNYEELSDTHTCFNFSLTSQSLTYDARILEYYKEHIEEGAVVFITVSYPSFFGVAETEESDFASKNMRYYDFLPNELIKDYNLKTDLLTMFPSLYAYETLPLALIGHYIDADTSLVGWEAEIDEVGLPDNTTSTIERHLVIDKLDENGNRIYNQEEIDALYEIIATCEEIGATPVLITHPFSYVYMYTIDLEMPDFYDDFNNVIETVVNDTGVAYYDYSRDSRFFNDFVYFRDTDHLNKAGATLFTEIVMDEIVYPIWEEEIDTK